MTRSPIELFWTAKNTNDDNDGSYDNYDGNFDENDDKNYQKTNKHKEFWVKFTNFRGYCMVKNSAKKFGQGSSARKLVLLCIFVKCTQATQCVVHILQALQTYYKSTDATLEIYPTSIRTLK